MAEVYNGVSHCVERSMVRKRNTESERLRVPPPMIKRRIPSGRSRGRSWVSVDNQRKSATRGPRAEEGVRPTEQQSRYERARREPPGPGCARLSPLESGLAARIGCPTKPGGRKRIAQGASPGSV